MLLTGLILESSSQKQNSIYFEEKNRKPTISPTRWGNRFLGNEDGSVLNCSQIMPFHIRGNKKTLEWKTSLKNKNAWGQPPGYCQTILFNQAFLLQEQEAANQVCILLWKKETERGRVFLRHCPHGRGRLLLSLSQWHFASLTKKLFFLLLRKQR